MFKNRLTYKKLYECLWKDYLRREPKIELIYKRLLEKSEREHSSFIKLAQLSNRAEVATAEEIREVIGEHLKVTSYSPIFKEGD